MLAKPSRERFATVATRELLEILKIIVLSGLNGKGLSTSDSTHFQFS